MNITEVGVLFFYLSGCYAIIYACNYPREYFQMVDNLWNTIKNEYLIPYVIKFVKMYSLSKNNLYQLKQDIYLYNPQCKYIFDLLSYGGLFIHAEYYDYSIEPFNNRWVDKINIIINNDNVKLESTYYIPDNNHLQPDWINYIALFNKLYTFDETKNTFYTESLLCGKFENSYVYRIEDKNLTDLPDFNRKSSTGFLSITLRFHNQNPIDIIISPNIMYVNNEILSRAFIMRYIKYNNLDCIYDDNYIIDIVDNNIEMNTLHAGDYIILSEDSYLIIKDNNANTD